MLILGGGASFHNFAAFGSPKAARFDDWLKPLMVAAGAANDVPARAIFRGTLLKTPFTCWLFD